ncbi:hypothetical protein XM38_041510 [Halomicronema hongdechloris C2206]|uniref:DUF5060 domain-containing protein n=1 Tax=Halomicronema hongdechloris C2206 TaxID=1641165 RepID=A0A1Z3HSB3_9CYAN|nr:DUF5060 domain-containing protein [Halomicronema hongdechloris]ASC73189.1 hypothetical protein XM38_041510 [Halomicronema hongdechloris C2206]
MKRNHLIHKTYLFIILLSFFNLSCTSQHENQSSSYPAVSEPTGNDLGKRNAMLWEHEDWDLNNPSWKDNPFDLVATVSFEHQNSNASHTTEMFYRGDNTWGFRFTGTHLGQWNFTTISNDPDLNGYYGSIIVRHNSNPNLAGFMTNIGNKFALQTTDTETLRPYLFNAYMNQQSFEESGFVGNWTDTQDTSIYLQDAKEHGFDTILFAINNSWFEFGSSGWDEHNSVNPDIETFEILENLIINTHRQGGRVHLWAWGDEERRWTPIGVGCNRLTRFLESCDGGINGEADRRLQRYIAARLGPLPGWTMNYGFDLQEWVSEEQTGRWADYLREHMGWPHLLWARGRFNSNLSVASYSGMGHTYEDAVSNLEADPTRPHIFEERDLYLREDFHTMDWTRQHLWRYTLAGGHGGFWGVGLDDDAKPYPNPEQLRTHQQFWLEEKRFLFAMRPANSLVTTGDGYVLKIPSNANYVVYQEDTDVIRVDLSEMQGEQLAIAVNTKNEYDEIDLGILEPGQQTLELPEVSDWAIAVGKFNQ